MTTGSCPPDETSLGVGQVQSYLQITTAWLGLTIPTPSGKQCQGRGSQDDDDYTSNIFILEAPLNRKTTMGNVMNPADRSMPAQTTVLQSQNFKICVINSGTIMSCVINSGTIIILCQNHLTADHTSVAWYNQDPPCHHPPSRALTSFTSLYQLYHQWGLVPHVWPASVSSWNGQQSQNMRLNR